MSRWMMRGSLCRYFSHDNTCRFVTISNSIIARNVQLRQELVGSAPGAPAGEVQLLSGH